MTQPFAPSRRADVYYVGSFDDEVLRHNDQGFNLASINETLSQAALFGGKLLINDGSLMLSVAGQQALTSRRDSPLLDLLQVGYVKLFSRNGGDLANLPLEMAARVPTYADLVASARWEPLRRCLVALQDDLDPGKCIESWPAANQSKGFARLANAALDSMEGSLSQSLLTAEQFHQLREEFNARMEADANKPGRTAWRQACEQESLGLLPEVKTHLHWAGLEAYHYNMAMISSEGHPNRRTGLVTRYSNLFERERRPANKQEAHGATLVEIPSPRLPLLTDRRALHRGSLLREVVTHGTDLNEAKSRYLAAVDDALLYRAALPEARKAAEHYGRELTLFLQSKKSGKTGALLTAVGLIAGAAASVHFAGGDANHFLPLLEVAAAKEAVQHSTAWLARQFQTSSGLLTMPLAVDVIDQLEDFSEHHAEIHADAQGSHWFAFVQLDQEAVKNHLAHVPPFKSDS